MPFCVYRCCKCRREFETSEGATACEESHVVRIMRSGIRLSADEVMDAMIADLEKL